MSKQMVKRISSEDVGLLHLDNSKNGRNEAENAANDCKCKWPVEVAVIVFWAKEDETNQHEHDYKQTISMNTTSNKPINMNTTSNKPISMNTTTNKPITMNTTTNKQSAWTPLQTNQ